MTDAGVFSLTTRGGALSVLVNFKTLPLQTDTHTHDPSWIWIAGDIHARVAVGLMVRIPF